MVVPSHVIHSFQDGSLDLIVVISEFGVSSNVLHPAIFNPSEAVLRDGTYFRVFSGKGHIILSRGLP